MSQKPRRKSGRGIKSLPIPVGRSRADGSDHTTRTDGAEVSPGMPESLSTSPSDPEIRASKQRLISYIARQIAMDILRDGWPSSRKRT
jgi:hypothetical protein